MSTSPVNPSARDLRLKSVPSDVLSIIYDQQNEMKKTAGRNVSVEKAVCRIIRLFRQAQEAREAVKK